MTGHLGHAPKAGVKRAISEQRGRSPLGRSAEREKKKTLATTYFPTNRSIIGAGGLNF